MAAGSWVRFLVGLALSIEAIRLSLSGDGSPAALVLAAIYILLVVAFAIFKF